MSRLNNPSDPPGNSPRQPTDPPLAGVLIIDKPLGISSMRAVAHVRRLARRTKTGHAGTLDPLATGVLVLALGKATKIIDQLMATDKRYRTVIDLSAFTATDDREGEREEVAVTTPPTERTIRDTIQQFIGTIEQRPPAFSAIKVKGRRAYKAARKGDTLELAPRRVTIHAIELVRYDWPELELDIHSEKGVYIRSLARDLGRALNTGGHCAAIRRTAVGPFTIDTARALDDLPDPIEQQHLIPIDESLAMVGRRAGEG